jgi:hypothetical protein
MNDSARTLFVAGRMQTLAHWANLLPPALRREAPELILYQAQTLGDRGQLHDALDLLQEVQQAFAAQRNEIGQARATLMEGWAYQVVGQLPDALRAGQEAARRLETTGPAGQLFYAQAVRRVGYVYSGMGRWQALSPSWRGHLPSPQISARRCALSTWRRTLQIGNAVPWDGGRRLLCSLSRWGCGAKSETRLCWRIA